MALDLGIDYNSGDLLIAPNNDIDLRYGPQTIEQRIRVRLMIRKGEWALDPTGGTLGSRLVDAMRLPVWRSVPQVAQMVKDALAPMTDITVTNVDVQVDEDNPDALNIVVTYSMIEQGGAMSDLVLSTSLTIQGF